MPSDRENHQSVNSLEILCAPLRFYTHHYFPLRREGRLIGSYLWFLPRAFFTHGGHGCGSHPAFPAPSVSDEGGLIGKTRTDRVARMLFYVSLGRHARVRPGHLRPCSPLDT